MLKAVSEILMAGPKSCGCSVCLTEAITGREQGLAALPSLAGVRPAECTPAA